MDYKGQACKICGEVIKVYSTSGYCRRCWHKRRGEDYNELVKKCSCGKIPESKGLCQYCYLLKHIEEHKSDLTHYHYVQYNGRREAEHTIIWLMNHNWDWDLLGGKVIHHINGLKGDNRNENLIALPRKEHDTNGGWTYEQRKGGAK